MEAEVGLVWARMQAGEMRAATSYANLVAGEHKESSAAVGVLAYVEDRLGYTEQALNRLAEARSKSPADVTLLAATSEILLDRGAGGRARSLLEEWTGAHGENAQVRRLEARLMRAPENKADAAMTDVWPAPFSEATGIGAGKVVEVANGFVVDGGTVVITHASVVGKSRGAVVIRNGLGLVRMARASEAQALAPGFVALRLASPFPKSASFDLADIGDVSQARFCFALGFAAIDAHRFSYPVVAPGVVFRASAGNEQLLQITNVLTRDQLGSPLFDDRGRLIGMALGSQSASTSAGYAMKDLGAGNFGLRIDGLRASKMASAESAAQKSKPSPPKPSIEELYERLSPAVVQVFVER